MRLLHAGTILPAVIGTLIWASTASAFTVAELDPGNFPDSTDIDNKWFPLKPGTQYIYDGESDRDGTGLRPHKVVFTVTDVTKVIDGVRTRVVWDRDIYDGTLSEEEIHFHAQDDDENVWSMGEYPEEFEDGVFTGAPATWLSGVDDGQGGIHMQGKAVVGSEAYQQGIAESVEFWNVAQAFAIHRPFCLPLVPLSCFRKVLQIHETSPLEPADGGVYKYYAKRLGAIMVEPAGNVEQESLTLTSVKRLSWADRKAANKRTLELDTRAYTEAAEIYGDSEPAELRRRHHDDDDDDDDDDHDDDD